MFNWSFCYHCVMIWPCILVLRQQYTKFSLSLFRPTYAKKSYLIHDSHFPFHSKMYIHLPVCCHLYPIWPSVFQLNLTFIWVVLLKLSLPNLPYTNFVVCLSKEFVQVWSPMWYFVRTYFLWGEFHSNIPNPKTGGSRLIGCPWVFIKCIPSYPL